MGITRLRLRFPSPALILSFLALFAALGGGAYATSSSGSSAIHFTNAKLKSSWTNFGSTSPPAGYAKDSLGVVHLRGAIKGGATFTPAFVLPKGLRPSHDIYVPVATGGGTEGTVEIVHNGIVEPNGSNVSGFTSLDGISFAAGE